MSAKNNASATPEEPDIDVEHAMAVIEKGQQLAGHYPSAETMARARKILTGETSPEEARLELQTALARIVDEERATHPANPNGISDEEVERRLARADGAIGAAGRQVTNPVTRDLFRQKVRGEITSEEYVRRVIENGVGHDSASSQPKG